MRAMRRLLVINWFGLITSVLLFIYVGIVFPETRIDDVAVRLRTFMSGAVPTVSTTVEPSLAIQRIELSQQVEGMLFRVVFVFILLAGLLFALNVRSVGMLRKQKRPSDGDA